MKEKGVLSFVKGDILTLWFKILVSCVPAAVVGLLFDDVLDAWFYHWYVVAAALIVFGIAFIVIENWNKGKNAKVTSLAELSYKAAFIIGMFQLIAAIFPGTSRSGATIVGALLIGVSRSVAAEFTFFLAIPVMFGASLLKVVKLFADGVTVTSLEWGILAVGCVTAFVVSLAAIRFLMDFVKKHSFASFGWYRIALGVLVLGYFSLFGRS